MKRVMLVLLAALIPGLATAQSAEKYQCNYGDLVRRVEVLHETADSAPCEVQYFKDTEAPGERQVLWSAGNEAGYCERKASEFLDKLRGWGWDCAAGADAAPEPPSAPELQEPEAVEEAPEDDTDALSAG